MATRDIGPYRHIVYVRNGKEWLPVFLTFRTKAERWLFRRLWRRMGGK